MGNKQTDHDHGFVPVHVHGHDHGVDHVDGTPAITITSTLVMEVS
jgi:hypothetical protein